MRTDEYDLTYFLEDIENLTDAEIGSMDPVEVAFGNEAIWFTQTHIAEIRELMALQNAADEYNESTTSIKPKNLTSDTIDAEDEPEDEPEEEVVIAGTDVYKDYIGKRVKHKAGGTGIVKGVDDKYISIEFEDGPKAGKTINYSLEMCINKGFLEIL